jgi:YD repeat-containing protein
MKNLSIRYVTGSILFIALCSCAYAQTSKLNTELNLSSSKEVAYNSEPKMAMPDDKTESSAGINTKAIKDFTRNYKKQNNANWFTIDDGFVAVFTNDGVNTKVYYDKKGRLIGDIRTYQENKLPKEVRHRVKSTYYDFNITSVNELTAGNQKVYLVKLEDKTSFKTIRIQEGEEMMETEVYQKSK